MHDVLLYALPLFGLCLVAGAWRHQVLAFRVDGTSSTLAVLAALAPLAAEEGGEAAFAPGPETCGALLHRLAVKLRHPCRRRSGAAGPCGR